MRNLLLLFTGLLMLCAGNRATAAGNSGKIKFYFTRPVNTSLATHEQAVYLNKLVDDTLIAYINRAKYTIDVAVYNFVLSGSISNIATAINNAYNRGVHVRWIYDGGSSNSGLTQLNSGIHTLGSPTTSAYGIMHNKFMIIDAGSANAADPIVWTGSCNWDAEQIDSDYNNIVIIQDQALAQAYTTEFNEMWGGTGLSPNTTNSKFGPYKTDNTPHNFTIDGISVESYFSPSDGTNSKILNAISSANSQLYFGVYTFTESPNADSIKSKIQSGLDVAGIIDQYSQSYSPYTILNPVMGNTLKVYQQSNSIYHNKFLIVDPCNTTSNPLVETGSHNWTVSADTKNDENILIFHDANIANIYYQSFYQNFSDLGGGITACAVTVNCNNAITSNTQATNVSCYGNSNGAATIHAHGAGAPFTYLWNTTQTDSVLHNVAAGTYTVTVTDGNGCSVSSSVSVSQPSSALSAAVTATGPECVYNTGSATCSTTGGTTPYSYHWSNNTSAATNNNLTPGNYSVTITDANNCTTTAVTTVNQAANLPQLSTSHTDAACSNNNGSAMVTVVSGTGPYAYNWSNGVNTTADNNIAAGAYTVTVTDAHNCTVTANAIVNSIGGPSVVATGSSTTCGNTNGSAQVAATGGTAPYVFLWSNGADSTSISGLAAGSYSVTVTDANGCPSIDIVAVGGSSAATAVITASNDTLTCNTNSAYQWYLDGNPIALANSIIYVATQSGTYTVLVTDSNGCTATSAGVPVTISGIANLRNNGVTIYPNPVSNILNIDIDNEWLNSTIDIINTNGQVVMTTKALRLQNIMPLALPAGVYIIRLTGPAGSCCKKFIKAD